MSEKVEVIETHTFKPWWVLLVDLAGFSDAVTRRPQEIASAYEKIVSFVSEGAAAEILAELPPDSVSPFLANWQNRVRIFSDSIFVFFDASSNPEMPWASPELIPPISALISIALWSRAIPHRGAIAFGDCLIDEKKSIFLGEPIVRAHRWEQVQNWFGISVEPRSLKETNKLQGNLTKKRQLLRADSVPTKEGEVFTLRVPLHWSVLSQPGRECVIDGFYEAYHDAIDRSLLSAISKYVATERILIKDGLPQEKTKPPY